MRKRLASPWFLIAVAVAVLAVGFGWNATQRYQQALDAQSTQVTAQQLEALRELALSQDASIDVTLESLPTREPVPTPVLVRQPISAEELGVTQDAQGRPYETAIYAESATTEQIGVLHAPLGRVVVLDGIGFTLDPTWESSSAPTADFGGVENLDLSIVWSNYAATDDNSDFQRVLGVRLDVPGSTVSEWGAFEHAYGTDGGLGAVAATSLVDHLRQNPIDIDDSFIDEDVMLGFDHYLLGDQDQVEGTDFVVFSNGWGDGGFPMTRGFDSDGEVVSLFVLDPHRHPWELTILDGTPPPDVTERRSQLEQCIAGTRDVVITTYSGEPHTQCSFD